MDINSINGCRKSKHHPEPRIWYLELSFSSDSVCHCHVSFLFNNFWIHAISTHFARGIRMFYTSLSNKIPERPATEGACHFPLHSTCGVSQPLLDVKESKQRLSHCPQETRSGDSFAHRTRSLFYCTFALPRGFSQEKITRCQPSHRCVVRRNVWSEILIHTVKKKKNKNLHILQLEIFHTCKWTALPGSPIAQLQAQEATSSSFFLLQSWLVCVMLNCTPL